MTAARWVVVGVSGWRGITRARQEDIKVWLKMHHIDPSLVPVDSEVSITGTGSDWHIAYERFHLDEVTGNVQVRPDRADEVWVEECTTPLAVDPPLEWCTPAV